MKSTGVVRKIDDLGRIVIPVELRNVFDLPNKTPMEFFVKDDAIVLRKYIPNHGCALCGKVSDKMLKHDRTGKNVCEECMTSKIGK